MAGRIYEPPGTPPSEVDPILRRKRKKVIERNKDGFVRGRKIPREFDYQGALPDPEPKTLISAMRYIERCGGEDVVLLLDMLGLIEPAEPPPSGVDNLGRKKRGPRKPKAAQPAASSTSDKMVSAMPSA